MTKCERETLLKICRQRERIAKTETSTVAAALKADLEQQLAREYNFDEDVIWKQAQERVEATWKKAAEEIAARCQELGIPREFAPALGRPEWWSRGQNALRSRRAELTRVAYSRIDQMQKEAKLKIEQNSLEIQTRLLAGGLESAEAKAFLEAMPSADELMPAITVAEVQRALAPAENFPAITEDWSWRTG
jgi:hypothetical protein